jgi:hypothetical protein
MMSSKQTILDRELFTQALRHMGEEDLLYLNRMVVERLNLLAQAKSTVELAQFAEGDRVQFTASDGSVKHGIVMRLNKKTASVRTDEGQSWKCCARPPPDEREPWRRMPVSARRLPAMRQQFFNPAGLVRGQPGKHILEVGVRVVPVHAR